jgi:hypothetical protein
MLKINDKVTVKDGWARGKTGTIHSLEKNLYGNQIAIVLWDEPYRNDSNQLIDRSTFGVASLELV